MCDDATRRRGEATVHLKFGKAAAITAGDFLSFQAFRLLYDGDWECETFQAISHKLVSSALEVCKGQGLDIYYTRKMDLWTVERYLSMAELKTGALIEAPLVSGAMVAGADTSHLNALGRIGKDLGLAFQIIDDSKDLLGSEANSQKSIFTDLRQGKCTIITALLNKSCRTADREAIDRILGQSNWTESDGLSVIQLCRRYRVLGQSQQICGRFSDSIDKNLATLPPSAARDVLHGVNDRIRDWCSLGDDNLD